MAVAMQQSRPVAPLPLVLGVLRTLHVAARIEPCCPTHAAHVLASGRGVEALLLALRDGPHALSQVGARWEERGRLPWLHEGLERASLHDDRLGQLLAALVAAQRTRVCGASALNALAVSTLSPAWLHQDTTTIPLEGAYEEEARPGAGLALPRPASGHSQEGRAALKQVLLRRGVSRAGLPRRMGRREGH